MPQTRRPALRELSLDRFTLFAPNKTVKSIPQSSNQLSNLNGGGWLSPSKRRVLVAEGLRPSQDASIASRSHIARTPLFAESSGRADSHLLSSSPVKRQLFPEPSKRARAPHSSVSSSVSSSRSSTKLYSENVAPSSDLHVSVLTPSARRLSSSHRNVLRGNPSTPTKSKSNSTLSSTPAQPLHFSNHKLNAHTDRHVSLVVSNPPDTPLSASRPPAPIDDKSSPFRTSLSSTRRRAIRSSSHYPGFDIFRDSKPYSFPESTNMDVAFVEDDKENSDIHDLALRSPKRKRDKEDGTQVDENLTTPTQNSRQSDGPRERAGKRTKQDAVAEVDTRRLALGKNSMPLDHKASRRILEMEVDYA